MRLALLILLTVLALTACAPAGVRHVVQPGQTLYRISKTYGVSADKIVAYNRIKDPTQIKAGETLWIPGARHTRTVAVVPSQTKTKVVAATTPTPTPAKKTSTPKPVASNGTPKRSTGTTVSSSGTKTTAVPARKGSLDWPVRGRILRNFGVKNGEQSKGIVIAAPEGTAVRSAAAGQVIYSGSGIKGYGHLLIIKHDNNLYTVYGHNQSNLVSSGTYVNKGQKIALSGQVPSFSQGGVHFEVRQGNQAVDPAFFLP